MKLTDKNNANNLFEILDASNFAYNLFLKHLVVLTDFGSEPLQRINKNFTDMFPTGKLVYNIGVGKKLYSFTSLPINGVLNNKRMKIDTVENLASGKYDKELCKDIIMLLIYGAATTDISTRAILFKCTPFEYLGNDSKIEDFVRKNYIRVSSIIRGKTATDLGNVAQQYVVDYLANALGENYNVRSNGTIPGVTQNDGTTLTSFDIVVDRKNDTSRHKKYIAVEVTFQETITTAIKNVDF